MEQTIGIYGIGTKVRKTNSRPFKSGLMVNTVKSVVAHPYKFNQVSKLHAPAYEFFEDDSIVETGSVIAVFNQ
jgi:hypothetical protein